MVRSPPRAAAPVGGVAGKSRHRSRHAKQQPRTPVQLHTRRCFVEAAISAGVKVGARRLDLSKRTDRAMGRAYGGNWPPDYKLEGVCAAQRLPPLPPEEVRQLLEKEKKFTAGRTDVDVVDGLYRRFFDGVSRAATVLDFHELGWGASEAQALAAVLPHFSALQKINLSRNQFDAAAGSALADALRANGSLTSLRYVALQATHAQNVYRSDLRWLRALQPSRKLHQRYGQGAWGGPQEQLIYQDARSVLLRSRASGRHGPGWRHCRQRLAHRARRPHELPWQ